MMSKDWVQRLGFLLGAFLLVGVVCIKNGKKIDNLPKIELLTKENAYLIEEETQGVYEISSKEISYTAIWGNQYNEFIPPNDIVKKTVDETVFPGASITSIETKNNISPPIIGENGAIGIFTKDDGTGWKCKAGEKISYYFEKCGMEKYNQALGIGYIKDGVMYSPTFYQKEEKGKFVAEVTNYAEFYIYIFFASADTFALKEGKIAIGRN